MTLASSMYTKVVLELADELPQYDLGIMLTTDEEVGGADGAGYLVKQQGWRADVVINLDAIASWQIEEQAKGIVRFEITGDGVSGHGSRPWAGQNAIMSLMACLQELAGHFPAEPCADPDHAHDSINVGVINGGLAWNQIPGKATAQIDIRYVPSQSFDDISELVQSVVARYPGVTVRLVHSGPAIKPIANNDYVRLFELLIAKIAGVKPQYTLSHGGSDSRFFAEHGIPTIMTGPPAGGHHSDNEWVEVKGAEQLGRIVAEFTREAGKVQQPQADLVKPA